ncbi:aldo/keto reductase [Salicibibacter halophilus]|uniref:Aldo/keto reductase n=1 Tax=Salicibibacter halophilus TaxID=2502791 RepID=A0A514LIJ4_9BACI|nr:aldo/keto reductase [Salicibibacter halophilus]QDI91673.1 aldo/keto reductase [Salicibibacter halophilus]
MERSDRIKEALQSHTVALPDGTSLPRIGQGTWKMGEYPEKKKEEIKALQFGLDLGMSVIDTAEMYGDGQSEQIVGEAVKNRRDEAFLISKVYPHNANLSNIHKACEKSLQRLKTDYLDMYLLHWRGLSDGSLQETVEGLEKLRKEGKILRWGVSNFDTSDMKELMGIENGSNCSINQVLYHLGSRGIDFDLLPWHREQQLPMMAYSPLGQGGSLISQLMNNLDIKEIAEKHQAKPLQIALAWTIRTKEILAIPKGTSQNHVMENAEAATIELSEDDLQKLDKVFPKPDRKMPLDII